MKMVPVRYLGDHQVKIVFLSSICPKKHYKVKPLSDAVLFDIQMCLGELEYFRSDDND